MIEIPKITLEKTNEIKLDPTNPNHMTKENLMALQRNIQKYGFLIPIITNKDLMIADGEHRYRAAKNIGMKEIPTIKLELDEVNRKIIRQVMNKLKGEHDKEKDLIDMHFIYENNRYEELRGLLPSAKDYSDILESKDEKDPDNFDIKKALAKPKYKVKQGDLFILGDHKLICGDSQDPETYKKLMGDETADVVITDPPYGVSYCGLNNPNGKEWEVIEGDDLRAEKLQEFIKLSFSAMRDFTKENPAVYCFYASRNHKYFEDGLNEAGFKVKQVLIWDKGHILGRSDYHWCHEPCLYAIKGEKNSTWYGDRAQKTVLNRTRSEFDNLKKEELINLLVGINESSDIIRIQKDFAGNYIHPTQKPVELAKRFIRNSTEINQIVMDPFCGSGWSIIAAEDTHRKARAIDIDPKYVSAIVERWENYTGAKHIKL